MKQLALIIGNNAYPESPLKNACNDAKMIAEKLTGLGYTCITGLNTSAVKLDKHLADFGEQLKQHDVGLFFFAGHGMQIDGENYLAGIDTKSESELDAKYSSLSLNKVIETMENAGNRTSVIILDACRNNPYERRWRGAGIRGLAPVSAPKGMIVAYATSPGQTACDGAFGHGAYTEALLAHIDRQNLAIEGFFKRVRNTLSSSTNGKQISWEHTSLMGDYYFNHAQVGDKLIASYSDSALADKDYRAPGPIGGIIAALQSHNWHKQNPAITKITMQDFNDAKKDECFVLGRNIYQSAVGGAHIASSFLQELDGKLGHLPANAAFHILNGILFEIYFDSQGKKRTAAKAGNFSDVLMLEGNPAYQESFQFIQQALSPYEAELFYMPGSEIELSVDVVLKKHDKNRPAVCMICVDGQNVLYDDEGTGYFELNDDSSLTKRTRAEFKEQLASALVVPPFRLKIAFSGYGASKNVDEFGTPFLNLQRIATY